MENELELLKFEVEDEIARYGLDTKIIVLYFKIDGNYLDHYIVDSTERYLPKQFVQIVKDINIYNTTLSDFYRELLTEIRRRKKE